MKVAKPIPEDIVDYIEYIDGRLYWKKTPPSRKQIDRTGRECGCISKATGYRLVGFKGERFTAHRIVWFIFKGQPDVTKVIDHNNKIRDDNRIENLSMTDKSGNAKNQKIRSDNKSGHTGIHWCKRDEVFVAQVVSNGVNRKLGTFKNIDDAIAARNEANKIFNFNENHGGKL